MIAERVGWQGSITWFRENVRRLRPEHRRIDPADQQAGLAMAFKLIEAAQDRWRAVNAPHLVALVRAGTTFINGKLVERPRQEAQPDAA